MPAERVPMRCVREILRLKYELGASDRAIRSASSAASVRVGGSGPAQPRPRQPAQIIGHRRARDGPAAGVYGYYRASGGGISDRLWRVPALRLCRERYIAPRRKTWEWPGGERRVWTGGE